jgi:hypothetical protein
VQARAQPPIHLFTSEEVRRARRQGFDWLAEEALEAKYAA